MSTSDVQFSVVIPTYNRAKLIGSAINSVLEQSKQPAEIIVVDDGSTDDTTSVVKSFGDAVRYLPQRNSGSARARDHGIHHAQAEWVALLDSDDVWLPEHLASMESAIINTYGKANFYFADTIEPPEKGGKRLWEVLNFQIEGEYEIAPDGTDWVVCNGRQPMMLQSSVLNKKAYLRAGGFHPALRYRDDTHMFMKLGINSPVCAVAGCGVEMRGDDTPENRLTLTYDVDKYRGAQMQIIMFKDLITSTSALSPRLKQYFNQRLAAAHRTVARHAFQKGKWSEALKHGGQSFVIAPGKFFEHSLNSLRHAKKA
jgi:glycosyltransferase involved in cell wall biosynthesis